MVLVQNPPPQSSDQDTPDPEALFKEAKRRERRRRLLYVGGALVTSLLIALSALAAAGGFSSPSGAGSGTRDSINIASNTRTHEYQLPSDGWKPGDGSVLAGIFGRFHATLTPYGACAWMATPNQGTVYLWPEGYRVRFHPTELIGPNGKVVARQGQEVNAGGGFYSQQEAASLSPPPAIPGYCGKAEGVALIESSVLPGRGPT